MLTIMRQAKIRKYRLENLLLVETLIFLCVLAGRVKDIMGLIRLGASPAGFYAGLSPRLRRRMEETILNSVPGVLTAQADVHDTRLELDLAWADLCANLSTSPRDGQLRVDLEIAGRGQDVMEMALDGPASIPTGPADGAHAPSAPSLCLARAMRVW
ncbi:conserved hypothetical protein [Desulfarculales bacterium]